MTSCLSGAGGRTYGFDFDFLESPSPSTFTSSTSSPSSTISESSNYPMTISTRKPRTSRKRPNQTYNEAATLLSTAYPNLFSAKTLKKLGKFTKPTEPFSFEQSSELLLPFKVFDTSCFLLHQPIPHKPSFSTDHKLLNLQEKPCHSMEEISSRATNPLELEDDCLEDFDAESILDEEIDEGIDSIMGSKAEYSNGACCNVERANQWFGFGGKSDFRVAGVRAFRHRVDDGSWLNFPAVDILEISPGINKSPAVPVPTTENKEQEKKNKNKKKKKPSEELRNPELATENSPPNPNPGLLLRLNYNEVRNAWSDRGSPFTDVPGNNVNVRWALIDLFSENGGVRDASVLRYKEKRRTRLFSKKIRYQIRKVNADRRSRTKIPLWVPLSNF